MKRSPLFHLGLLSAILLPFLLPSIVHAAAILIPPEIWIAAPIAFLFTIFLGLACMATQ